MLRKMSLTNVPQKNTNTKIHVRYRGTTAAGEIDRRTNRIHRYIPVICRAKSLEINHHVNARAANSRWKKFCESTRTGSRSPARSGTNPLTAGVAPFPPATTRQPLTRRLSPGPRAVDLPPPTTTHSPCANITYPTTITSAATFAKPPPSPLLPSPVSITMVMLTRCALHSCTEFIFSFFFFFFLLCFHKTRVSSINISFQCSYTVIRIAILLKSDIFIIRNDYKE